MLEKWLDPDESVVMEEKAFIWTKTKFNINGTWAIVYLTNKRFYAKDRIVRMKLANIPFSNIKELKSTDKHLVITGRDKGKDTLYEIKIRLKDIDDMWEPWIRGRLEGVRSLN
ncbi:MAG: hypothetical protein R6U61_00380 [Thermoplasmata archaeon]